MLKLLLSCIQNIRKKTPGQVIRHLSGSYLFDNRNLDHSKSQTILDTKNKYFFYKSLRIALFGKFKSTIFVKNSGIDVLAKFLTPRLTMPDKDKRQHKILVRLMRSYRFYFLLGRCVPARQLGLLTMSGFRELLLQPTDLILTPL